MSNGKTIQQQIAEFDVMKKSLMRDLQNRCERVVELEISLDETREQYNNVLRSSNNRAQQKKMAFLERNLEQLTQVQRQLVEQNSALKKEVAIAERKLIARNERIQSLESLLQDSQEKMAAANHKYVAPWNTSPPLKYRAQPIANVSLLLGSRSNLPRSRSVSKQPRQVAQRASTRPAEALAFLPRAAASRNPFVEAAAMALESLSSSHCRAKVPTTSEAAGSSTSRKPCTHLFFFSNGVYE
jgi:glutaminase